MRHIAPAERRTTLLAIGVAASLQTLILLCLLLVGHLERHVADIAVIYLIADLGILSFGKRLRYFRKPLYRILLYCSTIAIPLVYAAAVGFYRASNGQTGPF